ncbi:MAG: ATP-binding cassette domain-containing protein [Candidatus Devosia euplotis]|nr:ATP-binding cassette domain-containing protein [Candidatus Devosia euplotis]
MTACPITLPIERGSSVQQTRTVLEVDNLSLSFRNADGLLSITDISFAIRAGESVTLVGESGCGKSITAAAIMGIAPDNALIGWAVYLTSPAAPAGPAAAR